MRRILVLFLAGCAGIPDRTPPAISVTVRRIENGGGLVYDVEVCVERDGRIVTCPRMKMLPLQEGGVSITSSGVDPNGVSVPRREESELRLACSESGDGRIHLWIRVRERRAGKTAWAIERSVELPEGIPMRLER